MILEHDAKQCLTAILWDSVSEPEALCSNPAAWKSAAHMETAKGKFKGQGESGGEEWLGAPNRQVLMQRLKNGWPEGVQKIEQIATRELSAPASVRRRRIRGDHGDELDMQAVWRGDLTRAWSRTRRANRVGPRVINIIIDLGANAGTSSKQLFWRGASALRLAQLLTESGYNVALYGAIGIRRADSSGKLNAAQLVEIKSTDSPLDMDKLAALTAMAGFFRTSMFAGIVYAADQHNNNDVDWGLGSAEPENIAKAVKLLPIPQDVIIQRNVLSEEAANKWIDEALLQIDKPQLKEAA